jgi:hypothetical protein
VTVATGLVIFFATSENGHWRQPRDCGTSARRANTKFTGRGPLRRQGTAQNPDAGRGQVQRLVRP